MIRIAINGFGRIGRNFLRALFTDPKACQKITVCAINIGKAKPELVAYMFKYDTLMGIYPGTVTCTANKLIVDNYTIDIIAQMDMSQLPWKQYAIDCVVDCSGAATKREKAEQHIQAGARTVLISAPAKNEDIAIVMGVNDEQFDAKKHTIISLGSCTTNALIPIANVMHSTFGIVHGFMTTTHAYTNSQVLLDVEAKDARSSRAAALNIIPSTTGAAKVLGKILPELGDRITCSAVRVPVAKVSLLELTCMYQKPVSVDAIHDALYQAAEGRMKHILSITNEPLVSSDFSGNAHSVIVDGLLTHVQGPLAKVSGWYDNEWAYSVRLKDFLMQYM